GAEKRGKQELEAALVASSTLVVDVLEQCAEIGELQHALAAGLMTRDGVHAELADVVSGHRPGRTREDEITIFDSSGTALQDVAAAVAVYEKTHAAGRGTTGGLDARRSAVGALAWGSRQPARRAGRPFVAGQTH